MKLKKKSVLEQEKLAILERMHEMDPCDDMYGKLCDRLDTINALEKKMKSGKGVSGDTIALISANLAGIVLVLLWEEKHVIATKAFNMITKLKI